MYARSLLTSVNNITLYKPSPVYYYYTEYDSFVNPRETEPAAVSHNIICVNTMYNICIYISTGVFYIVHIICRRMNLFSRKSLVLKKQASSLTK